MTKLKVVIGIPTYKRYRGLLRLLNSLAAQNCDFEFEIIVADNEGKDGIGHKVVKEIKDSYPRAIKVIPVTDRGISHVRNALMHEAFYELHADVIAMVDDDEVVDENWISELVNAHLKSGAQVIGGAIYPEFDTEPPEWTKKSKLYFRTIHPEGFVPLIQAAGNILLHRSIYDDKVAIYFDPAFGFTGGEDKEFFTRLKNKGVKFYYCTQAKSYEFYDSERITKEWALARSYRIGNNDIRIIKSIGLNGKKKLFSFITSFAGLFIYTIKYCLAFNRKNKFNLKLKIYRQLGKLSAFFGSSKESYR